MKTGNINVRVAELDSRDSISTSSENQSELLGDLAWEHRMAILEEIHREIAPQLEALRASDEDQVVGLALA